MNYAQKAKTSNRNLADETFKKRKASNCRAYATKAQNKTTAEHKTYDICNNALCLEQCDLACVKYLKAPKNAKHGSNKDATLAEQYINFTDVLYSNDRYFNKYTGQIENLWREAALRS